MGRVYRARDTRLGRDVAIKVSHEAFSDRFEREARDRSVGPLQLPDGTNSVAGFSMHPDGTHFLISAPVWPYDIWLIEGFAPRQRPLAWLLGN